MRDNIQLLVNDLWQVDFVFIDCLVWMIVFVSLEGTH